MVGLGASSPPKKGLLRIVWLLVFSAIVGSCAWVVLRNLL